MATNTAKTQKTPQEFIIANGGALVSTLKRYGTEWEVYVVRGGTTRRFYVNVFRNGDRVGTFSSLEAIRNAPIKMPKEVRKSAIRALFNGDKLLQNTNSDQDDCCAQGAS